MRSRGITRLNAAGHPQHGLSAWSEMPLVGAALGDAVPKERYYRVLDTLIESPAEVRAGVWEATAYAEKVTDYPYHEIVFVVSGSMSIFDAAGHEESFGPGEGFFLEKGFNGEWRQHDTVTIFHMTVDPKDNE